VAYDSKAIANRFLDLAERSGKQLNPMKIQKLVYYAHGWNLTLYDRPLIDEAVEAWTYGPVIPSLYHEFKRYGSGPILEKATKVEFNDREGRSFRIVTPSIDDYPDQAVNEETKELLDSVWEAYGDLSAVQLSNLTHAPDSPWSRAYSDSGGRKGVDIPDDIIKSHFAPRV
jgi:uncharacterized phage-associated protein